MTNLIIVFAVVFVVTAGTIYWSFKTELTSALVFALVAVGVVGLLILGIVDLGHLF